MPVRLAVVFAAVVAAAAPAFAETLNADAARRFAANKQFSFTCFEGSVGSGRIGGDGSVVGVIRMRGAPPTRFIHMPPGTLFTRGEAVCSYVKGAFFNPCFNLDKTGANSFRGAVSGFGFAYCDFIKRNGGRDMVASVASPDDTPLPMPRSIRRGAKVKHDQPATTASTARAAAPSAPVAAPTTPVTTAPLPSMGETGMRGSVSQ